MEKTSMDAQSGDAEVIRLRPLKVLVVSGDRRFRAVIAMLLTRRDVSVLSASSLKQVETLLGAGLVDVAVIDGTALLGDVNAVLERVAPLTAPVGVVLALDEVESQPSELVTIAKWAPFECVYAAIGRADRRRPAQRPPAEGVPRLKLLATGAHL
jgi:hypothetical protein